MLWGEAVPRSTSLIESGAQSACSATELIKAAVLFRRALTCEPFK